MSNDTGINDDDDLEVDDSTLLRKLRQQLKESNRRIAELTEQVEAGKSAARKVAFMEAGIPDNPQTRYFREHYSGDLTPEAVKAAAVEHGFATAENAEQTAEINAIESISQASTGAESTINPGTEAALNQALEQAAMRSPEAVAEVMRQHGIPVA